VTDSDNVISFCDVSGVMVEPWLAAGYNCWIVDFQHPRGVTRNGRLYRVGADMHELFRGHRWLPPHAHFASAFSECTHLCYSGQRWRRENRPRATAMGFMLFAACWDLCLAYEETGARWMIENPDGIVCSWCKPDHTFHPNDYGDPYTKRTNLWTGGGFVMPEKSPVPVDPTTGDRIHKAAPGAERHNLRSITPAGFAKAVFRANCKATLPRAAYDAPEMAEFLEGQSS
jgi:hypothetical protein